jgi:ribosomal protein L29
MKKTQIQQLKAQDPKKLTQKLTQLKNEYQKAKIQITASEEKNIKKAKNIRRDIAQISSIITQKTKKKNKK